MVRKIVGNGLPRWHSAPKVRALPSPLNPEFAMPKPDATDPESTDRAASDPTLNEAFEAASDRTLREALALSPAERVELSESLWRELAPMRPPHRPFTISFKTFEEYRRWQDAGGELTVGRE